MAAVAFKTRGGVHGYQETWKLLQVQLHRRVDQYKGLPWKTPTIRKYYNAGWYDW